MHRRFTRSSCHWVAIKIVVDSLDFGVYIGTTTKLSIPLDREGNVTVPQQGRDIRKGYIKVSKCLGEYVTKIMEPQG